MNKRGAETGQLGLCAVIAAVAIVAIVGLVIFFGRQGGVLAASENACDQLASLKAMFCPDSPACSGVSNAFVKAGCGAAPTCFSILTWRDSNNNAAAYDDCLAKNGGYCNICSQIYEKGSPCGDCIVPDPIGDNLPECNSCQAILAAGGCSGMCAA